MKILAMEKRKDRTAYFQMSIIILSSSAHASFWSFYFVRFVSPFTKQENPCISDWKLYAHQYLEIWIQSTLARHVDLHSLT